MATRITLPSGDVSAQGNYADYTIRLNPPLVLDSDRKYEVCLVRGWLPVPGGGFSTFIQCSLCDYTRVGSGNAQLLYQVEPTADAGLYKVVPDGIVPEWVPIYGSTFDSVRVWATYSTGLPVPSTGNPATDYTTVTVMIRERPRT